MVTAPLVVERVVRVPKLSALRNIGGKPQQENLIVLQQLSRRKKRGDNLRDILMLRIRRVVHAPHVGGADATAKAFERDADLRVLEQRLCTRDWCRVVRR